LKKLKFPNIRWPSREQIQDNFKELALIAGFFVLARGLYLIYPAAAWIVSGLVLLWLGWPDRQVKK
jgi:hypothetical protein